MADDPDDPADANASDASGVRLPPDRRLDALGRNVPATRHRGGTAPKLSPARLLAQHLSEVWTPEETTRHLTAIARGQDPNAAIDPQTGRPKGEVPPDWVTRRWAMTTILDRTVGRPKAHVVLEGGLDVKQQVDVKIATFALDARDLDLALPGDELEAFRRMQKTLVARAKQKVAMLSGRTTDGHRVIDAESTEVDE